MYGRKGSIALLAALAVVATLAASAQARPGFYLGIGAAQQSVKGDLDGTHTYLASSTGPGFGDGELDSGSIGLAATVGYGLNRFLALEYLYADTQHKATNPGGGKSSDAQFTSQLIGARLTAPFSQRVEGFLRAGYGIYDVAIDDHSVNLTTGSVGKVAFHGTGTGLGIGLEFMFNELGIGVGYTQHNYKIDRAKPDGSKEVGLPSDLTGTATTTDVMFTWHF
jgi:hypothetical protein